MTKTLFRERKLRRANRLGRPILRRDYYIVFKHGPAACRSRSGGGLQQPQGNAKNEAISK